MADLLVEVDEALKQERLEKLWKQYGGFFLGLIAAIIIGTAANAGYYHYKEKKAHEQTELYLSAVVEDSRTADDLLAVSEKLDPTLAALAKFQAAGLLAKDDDKTAAINLYASIENDNNAPESIKFAAFYMHTNLSEAMTADEKLARFETILGQKTNPWLFHAHLEAALILANEKQDFTKARTHLDAIMKDTNVIQSIQKKAQSLDVLYKLKEKI